MVPGAFTRLSPSRCASPERGCTKPAYPSGMATATPVPTRARWKGASSTSSATDRSAPASPGSAYRGGTASSEVSRTGTSSSGISGTSATLAAPRPEPRRTVPTRDLGIVAGGPEVGDDALGERLGGAAVAPSGDRGPDQERGGSRHRAGQLARHPAAQRPHPGAA